MGIWDNAQCWFLTCLWMFTLLGNFAESHFFSFCPHNPNKNNTKSGGQRGVGLGISSIASSSFGDRKKGYPKRQALWELTLALGRVPVDVVTVFLCLFIFMAFKGFCCDFGILRSHSDILGVSKMWGSGTMRSVGF